MLISDQMPDLNRYSKAEDKINALYQYLFTMKQQINYVLSNLDEENLNAQLVEKLTAKASQEETVQKSAGTETAKCECALKITDEAVDLEERYLDNARFR